MDSIVVAVAAGGLRGEEREYGRFANTSAAVDAIPARPRFVAKPQRRAVAAELAQQTVQRLFPCACRTVAQPPPRENPREDSSVRCYPLASRRC
jgi:hypothetical protein